ncbi:DUF3325 domain-containing protein [Zhongshania aliphaticivorans]|uniref:DUF3325 domain-containing protein n=1 Tax=Zhongshania aliphaticivorans TaxID=1470434 RepID=UPI0012E534B4|nr:DUF3325 domain-containing protein [Zhongshania aliphaticivorans]CAA0119578.1 Uncharacterised protein [Zhongshania aliphaticivorans]
MTTTNIAIFIFSLFGFAALAMAMTRHSKLVFGKALPANQRGVLRIGGWLLLAIALGLGIYQWQFDVGTVAWLGWLSIAGLLVVFNLSRKQKPHKTPHANPKKHNTESNDGIAVSAGITARRLPVPYAALAAAALLIPLASFGWQLASTPKKALLRDDAVHGKIGPWSFSLAEKDQDAPELVAMDIPLKQFVIRFCDNCETQIRMAYFKVRKPHALRAAGNAFEGRGTEKTAEIPIPAAATETDDLWLTVEAKNGEVYTQEFAIPRLSPALNQFIKDKS